MTTESLIAQLTARGLEVTSNMLRQDVKERYIPHPASESRGGQRIGRIWENWEVKRVIYLYRLRNRGAKGQVLKVLLFLRDGWGWNDVKPICLTGLRKAIDIQSSPVRRRVRNYTEENVTFIAEDAAEIASIDIHTGLFIWGMGLFGKVLEGASLSPIYDAIHELAIGGEPDEDTKQMMFFAQQLIAGMGMTGESVVNAVETADDEKVELARRMLIQQIDLWRSWIRGYYNRNNIKASTNILTLCGQSEQQLSKGFRELPKRITPAQTLAAMIAPFIFIQSALLSMVMSLLPKPE